MNAIIYTRVSTDEQAADPFNLLKQEECCRTFCVQRGYTVVKVFTDADSARTADRSAFQEMRLFCRHHKRDVDCVVVQDLSRFARNLQDQTRCIADLKVLGVKLCSVYEQSVDDSASGTLTAKEYLNK